MGYILKSTGIVRKTDQLGRVVLPIEVRRILGIHEKDPLEIYVDEDKIVLKKYTPHNVCDVTGEVTSNNKSFAGGKLTLSPKGAKILLQELEKIGKS